jgi:Carbohydrate esterase, sialic acid-specific acetylesterase
MSHIRSNIISHLKSYTRLPTIPLIGGSTSPLPNGSITQASRGSVWFDGVDDYYTMADSARFDYPNADWFEVALIHLTYNVGTRYIASFGAQGGTHNVQLYQTVSGGLATITAQVRSGTGGAVTPVAGATLPINTWAVVGVQRVGTQVQIFTCPLNGAATFGTLLAWADAAAITPALPASGHTIGARSSSQTGTFWNNAISYVAKGSGNLSGADLAVLASGSDIQTDLGKSLDLYYRLDIAASTITNSVVSNNDPATRVSIPLTRGGPVLTGLPISINGLSDYGRVYQRNGTSRVLQFTGGYRGAPTGIEARIIGFDNAEVYGWTDCIATGVGTWGIEFTIPQGYSDYIFDVRFKNDSTRYQRSCHPFGVGITIFGTGQSNFRNMQASGSRTLDARKHSVYQFTTNVGTVRDVRVTNAGAGGAELLFHFQANNGEAVPVMLVDAAWSGSSLTATGGWQDTDPVTGVVWNNFLAAVAAVGTTEGIVFHQGEADASAGVARSLYESTLPTVVTRMRTALGKTSAELPFFLWTLGHAGTTQTNPTNWREIRTVHVNLRTTIPNIYPVGAAYVLDLVDALHYVTTQNGYIDLGCFVAQALLNYWRPGTYATNMDGPFITGAALSGGNTITITFNLNNNTSLFIPNASPANLDGLVVRDGSNTLQAVSSWAIAGNTLVLTMTNTPIAGWTVDYVGMDIIRVTGGAYNIADNDNMLYGSNTVVGTSRRVPARHLAASITL